MGDTFSELIVKAMGFYKDGVIDKALVFFKSASELQPDNIHLHQQVADLYTKTGYTDAAIWEYQLIAGLFAAEGELLKAIATCKAILELDPDHTETQQTLASLYSQKESSEDFEFDFFEMPETMSGAIPSAVIQTPENADSTEKLLKRRAFEGLGGNSLESADEFDIDIEITEPESNKARVDRSSLPEFPVFSELPREAFIAIIDHLNKHWTSPGESIIEEGSSDDSMYLIIQGEFEVVREHTTTSEATVLARLGPGAYFGEMELLVTAPRLATVRSVDEGLILELDNKGFEALCSQHPPVKSIIERQFRSRLIDNIISTSSIFKEYPAQAREYFIEHSAVYPMEPDCEILKQGSDSQGVYLILRGACRVFRHDTHHREQELAFLSEGDIFGEISTMLNKPCTATVKTTVPCIVLHITQEAFRELFTEYDQVLFSMDGMVQHRLSQLEKLV
jgi:cAMP-dependent protein kinase regulator